MKYLTFLPFLHAPILAGTKTTTIRGSSRIRAGEAFALKFWSGAAYRSPQGRLGLAMMAVVVPVQLLPGDTVYLNGVQLAAGQLDDFAIRDGFPCWENLRDHFAARLPFDGFHHTWRDLVADPPKGTR